MRNLSRYLAVLLAVPMFAGSALAQPPPDLNYQGRLLDSAGEAVVGPANLQIRIFDQASDGTLLYSEDHPGLALTDGVFQVLLGTGSSPVGTFDAVLFSEMNRWLEVLVNGEILEPRQPFSSVAYAFRSQASQTAADADTLDGLDASALDQSAHVGDTANPHGVTAGQAGAATAGFVDAAIATHTGDSSAHHAKTISFGELSDQISDAQIPAGITRDPEFQSGDAALQDQITALRGELAALQATVASLSSLLAGVERNGDTVRFAGMNVQVVSGGGATDAPVNGLGNLIIGYNEPSLVGNDRTGSHNLIVGSRHNFSSFGGLIAGDSNTISGMYASISGGSANTASGMFSSVSGGSNNEASGTFSSVSGGSSNEATNLSASVSGGSRNTASGTNASVSGGDLGTASGTRSSVSGGAISAASGEESSVSGGLFNTAAGRGSSVSGGRANSAMGRQSSVLGGGGVAFEQGNLAFADYSAILGGRSNVAGDADGGDPAVGEASTVAGGRLNKATGFSSTVSGGQENLASNTEASVSGGVRNTASGNNASVSGGIDNQATGFNASVSGGQENIASGSEGSVSGGLRNEASGNNASVSGGLSRTASGAEDWRAGSLFEDF